MLPKNSKLPIMPLSIKEDVLEDTQSSIGIKSGVVITPSASNIHFPIFFMDVLIIKQELFQLQLFRSF